MPRRNEGGGYEVPGDRAAATGERRFLRTLIIILMAVALLLVAALVGYLVLSNTPVFTITGIDAEDSEHLSAENVAKLADVSTGTTLLTLDEEAITKNLKRNPWVQDVSYVREFPDRLKIVITERRVDCLVKMSTGSVCWCLGNDNVWIEPVNLSIKDGQAANEVALAKAKSMEATLILDVPTTMSPTAGEAATDEVLKAISTYREEFSRAFSERIVCFSASSVESVSCTLDNGVEVSLGTPVNIDVKEALVTEILDKHPNQITYINVRVPSQPSYRKLGVETVSEGTGVTTSIVVDDATQDELAQGSGAESGANAMTGEGSATSADGTAADGTSPDATSADGTTQGQGGQTTGDGATGTDGSTPTGDGAPTQGQRADGVEMGDDTGDLILGEDGYYYTYEQYYGLDG